MKFTVFTQHLPALTFACTLGFAPVAFAQTSTGGAMAAMPGMAPVINAPAAVASAATSAATDSANNAANAATSAATNAANSATSAVTNKVNSAATSATNIATSAVKSVTPLPKTNEFKTQADATAHCPSDTVVWSTLSKGKSYHLSSSKEFGKTKHGAYVCKADADAAGFHQAQN